MTKPSSGRVSKVSCNNLELARKKLSANNLEAGLPGRERHSDEIFKFLYGKLKIRKTAEAKKARVKAGLVADIKSRHMNKTLFVCGVPGTGKTTTVQMVVNKLYKQLIQTPSTIHPFEYIYVNGQLFTTPEKVYSEIYYQLTHQMIPPEKAQDKLDSILRGNSNYDDNNYDEEEDDGASRTTRSRKSKKKVVEVNKDTFKIVVLDELDLLYNERKQSVFYNLFDWPTSSESNMILITIANAMDLPERFMRGRVTSRMGWDKLVFESYTSDCLETILKVRLGQELLDKTFEQSAIIIATKRIGRTTGDARRILDTCRLAIDKAIQCKLPKVTPAIIDQVGFQNLDCQRRDYIKNCPPLELMVLKCILTEVRNVGEENVDTYGVYRSVTSMLRKYKFFQDYVIGPQEYQNILNTLAGVAMIVLEPGKAFYDKHLFIKDSSDVFRDLIKTEEVKV